MKHVQVSITEETENRRFSFFFHVFRAEKTHIVSEYKYVSIGFISSGGVPRSTDPYQMQPARNH